VGSGGLSLAFGAMERRKGEMRAGLCLRSSEEVMRSLWAERNHARGGEGRCGRATGTRVRDRREATRRRRVSKLMARAAMACKQNRVRGGKDIASSFRTNGAKGLKLLSVD